MKLWNLSILLSLGIGFTTFGCKTKQASQTSTAQSNVGGSEVSAQEQIFYNKFERQLDYYNKVLQQEDNGDDVFAKFSEDVKKDADCALAQRSIDAGSPNFIYLRRCPELNMAYNPQYLTLNTKDYDSCEATIEKFIFKRNSFTMGEGQKIDRGVFPKDICLGVKKINRKRAKLNIAREKENEKRKLSGESPLPMLSMVKHDAHHVSIMIPPSPRIKPEMDRKTTIEMKRKAREKLTKTLNWDYEIVNEDTGRVEKIEMNKTITKPQFLKGITSAYEEFMYTGDACQQGLKRGTGAMLLYGIAAIGAIYAAPQDISNWSDEQKDLSRIFENYSTHVTSTPVWDKDHWAVNYIGHPYSGMAYYAIARHSDCGIWKSTFYSFAMSTFFWEYGLEGTFEVPSIQDLLFTWSIGSLMGEAAYHLSNKIEDNNGRVWNSEKFGSFLKFLLNPAMEATDAFERMGLDQVKKPRIFTRSVDGTQIYGVQMRFGT